MNSFCVKPLPPPTASQHDGYFLLFQMRRGVFRVTRPWISSSSAFILPWETGDVLGSAMCGGELWFDNSLFLPGEAQLLNY